MLFENNSLKKISLFVTVLFLVIVFYLIYNSYFIIKKQFIDINNFTYINQVKEDEYTKKLAKDLVKECQIGDEYCKVQSVLNFVTNIPYKINKSVARSSRNVVCQNYGDCDDKSNLLISLLRVLKKEAYLVLVPKHIFVIVKLKNDSRLNNLKTLNVNKEKFYILESTAKNSKIGFPLRYSLKEIEAIIDPFKNKQLKINKLNYF